MPELFGSDSMSEAHEDITAFTIIPSPDLECKLGVDLRAIYEQISIGIPVWLNFKSWFEPDRASIDLTWNSDLIRRIWKILPLSVLSSQQVSALATTTEFAQPKLSLRRRPGTESVRSGRRPARGSGYAAGCADHIVISRVTTNSGVGNHQRRGIVDLQGDASQWLMA